MQTKVESDPRDLLKSWKAIVKFAISLQTFIKSTLG